MNSQTLARSLFSTYHRYHVDHLSAKNCKHEEVQAYLDELVPQSKGLLKSEEIGRSLEERSIKLVTCGKGRRKVMLWSQMHGDESTATLALMDILSSLVHRHGNDKWVNEMLERTTLYLVPMLNPDGAERIQRRTAANIDINRDALTLATHEAQILRNVQHRLKPAFGFNLHDQELSSVGQSKNVTAVALLAPALDAKKKEPLVRRRAMKIGAVVARALEQFIEGHIARYDDTFESRAFGDNMQRWGTSTLLIESGHWPNDREKKFVRKLNYVGILTAVSTIGDGSYERVPLKVYRSLRLNGKNLYDIVIRNVVVEHPSGWSHKVDVGLTQQTNTTWFSENVMVKDIGDLRTHAGLEIIDGSGGRMASDAIAVEQVLPLRALLTRLQIQRSPT